MSEETICVRDHRHPCEHGSLWPHWEHISTARWWQEPDCLGGREMVLRRRSDGAWEEIRAAAAPSAGAASGVDPD